MLDFFASQLEILNVAVFCLQALGREDAGDFEQALRYTVMCYRQPAKFYAEVYIRNTKHQKHANAINKLLAVYLYRSS